MLALFVAIVTAYLIPLTVFSLAAAFRHSAKVGLSLAAVFSVLHFSSGLGTLHGILDFLILRKHITPADIRNVPLTRDAEFVRGSVSSSPTVSVIIPCRNECAVDWFVPGIRSCDRFSQGSAGGVRR